MVIYLASPLGFTESGRSFYYSTLLPALRAQGHDVLDPWCSGQEPQIKKAQQITAAHHRKRAWRKISRIIAKRNVDAIEQCDLIVAVLDGTDVDGGTAVEIGYGFARGKIIVGYRSDFRIAADNEGSCLNLQIEYFVTQSGGSIVTTLASVLRAVRKISKRLPPHHGA